MNWKAVCIEYLKYRMYIDLIASIPYAFIQKAITASEPNDDAITRTTIKTNQVFKLLKIVRFMRLFRLIWVAKCKAFWKIEDEIVNEKLNGLM